MADPTRAAAASEPVSAPEPVRTPAQAPGPVQAPHGVPTADSAPLPDSAAALPHRGEAEHRVPRERRPTPWGRTALVLAVLMVVVLTSALVVNAPGRYLESTILALIADGLSVLALIAGIVGIVARRDRGAAIAAVLIAVLGNPFVLLYGLGALT